MDTSNPVPFRTTEPILALSLRMAGCPMWVPPMNVYDEEILGKAGYSYRANGVKWKLREAARDADEKKIRGRVEYYFDKTKELDHLLKAFAEQEKELNAKGNDMDAGERIRQIMALATRPPEDRPEIPGPVMDEREALIRIFCIGFKFRVPFINQFREWTSFLEITKGAKEPQQIDKDTTRFFPGLNRVPVNASDATLKRMKLL